MSASGVPGLAWYVDDRGASLVVLGRGKNDASKSEKYSLHSVSPLAPCNVAEYVRGSWASRGRLQIRSSPVAAGHKHHQTNRLQTERTPGHLRYLERDTGARRGNETQPKSES